MPVIHPKIAKQRPIERHAWPLQPLSDNTQQVTPVILAVHHGLSSCLSGEGLGAWRPHKGGVMQPMSQVQQPEPIYTHPMSGKKVTAWAFVAQIPRY